MAKKRKSTALSLDEVDRTMYASFCSATNSLSQLYIQAMNHRKLSFQAGECHGLIYRLQPRYNMRAGHCLRKTNYFLKSSSLTQHFNMWF
ncbi:hypothetical protein K1719_012487 [Acacia pycnantha]|nr:hypothetical protein K1719_012487 [Acacia pycnantha]